MTILQINEVLNGSTGSIMREITSKAEQLGNKVYIAYGYGNSKDLKAYRIGAIWEKKIHALIFTRILGLHGFGSILSTYKFLKWIDIIKPNVIHIHNLHTNYINFPLLYKYIIRKKIPVVMTLHDCYNFTGQCEHYSGIGCNKYKTGCGNCPSLHHTIAPSWIFDWSYWLLKKKKQWYEQIDNMTIVAVSKWLKKDSSESILNSPQHNITYIYNWIDTNIFYPRSEEEQLNIRRKYGLNEKMKYILTVGAGWNKNTTKFQDAIRLSEQLPSDYQLILVGKLTKGTVLPNNIKHIDFTNNPSELAAIYTLAEAYVHLSVCDTFGKVIAEAMACGTLPMVFDSTACPEIVGKLGVVVKPHYVEGFIEAINTHFNEKINPQELIMYVKKNYNKNSNIQKYIDIYNSIKQN